MKIRKLSVLALFLGGIVMMFGGCGVFGHHVATGDVVSRTFHLADFTEVSIGGSRDIVFRHSENHSVTIEMQESLFDVLRVDVRGRTLNISFDGSVTHSIRPRVYVYAPGLQSVSLSGSVSAAGHDANMFADVVSISMSGSGNAAFTMDVTRLGIGTSGSSRLELTGTADNVNIDQSGSGTISALNLQAQNAGISRSGSGSVYVSVSDSLDISASGSGRVRYRGNPSIMQSTSGSGTVSRID